MLRNVGKTVEGARQDRVAALWEIQSHHTDDHGVELQDTSSKDPWLFLGISGHAVARLSPHTFISRWGGSRNATMIWLLETDKRHKMAVCTWESLGAGWWTNVSQRTLGGREDRDRGHPGCAMVQGSKALLMVCSLGRYGSAPARSHPKTRVHHDARHSAASAIVQPIPTVSYNCCDPQRKSGAIG